MKSKTKKDSKTRKDAAKKSTSSNADLTDQIAELAVRLILLARHCEEANYWCPDEPLFSYQSMSLAEAERIKHENIPKAVGIAAMEAATKRLLWEEGEKKRILDTWRKRAEELRNGEFIDRKAESKAFFEAHKDDPDGGRSVFNEYRRIQQEERERNRKAHDKDFFYYVTPKTPKPQNASWWFYNRILEQSCERMMWFLEGQRIGEGLSDARHAENWEKPPTFDDLFAETIRQVEGKPGGSAAATALNYMLKAIHAFDGVVSPDDMKYSQRERAARWLKAQSADGAAPSIPDAAAQFGNEIEAERKSGGYASVNALRKALYYHAKELGIAQFAKRINKKTPTMHQPTSHPSP